MIFKELTETQFKEFSELHPARSFLQTPNMANLQMTKGHRIYYVGVINNEILVCASLIIGIKSRFGYYYSAPRGYLIDFNDDALLAFFNANLVTFLKNRQGYLFNIEPKVLYIQRDIDGSPVLGGFNHQTIVDKLIQLGFHHNGFYIELDLSKQVRWAFVLNYETKNEDTIFNEFKATTRNLIRKAIKYHVSVEELPYERLDEFKKIVDSTGLRKSFDSRPLSYYQSMYHHFHKDGYLKFMVAKVNLTSLTETLLLEKNQLDAKLAKLSDNSSGKYIEYTEALNGIHKRLEEAATFKEKYGESPLLAGGMFMLYGDESVYLYSGSYEDLMVYNGQYLIQWEIIKYGLSHGFKRHNFYGISGDFSKSNKRWGVYEFKRGFNGEVIEYIGDFDYILNPINYKASQLIKKVRGH